MQKIPTPDLSPEVLASLTTLMQAQAQECIYIKAVADKMKEKVCKDYNLFHQIILFYLWILLNSAIRITCDLNIILVNGQVTSFESYVESTAILLYIR